MHYTNNGINLYKGDMQIGDREATIEEVEAYEAKKELAFKVNEAKAYLASTDYKVLPDYEPKSEEIIALRATAREFIRANDVSNP